MDREVTNDDRVYMHIPKNYWKSEYGLNSNAIEDKVKNILDTFSKNLIVVLFGPEYSGRTSLGVLCLEEAWKKGTIGYMIGNEELLSRRDNLYSDGITVLERCQQVAVLLVDDIFVAGIKSEKQMEVLRSVLRHRVNWRKPTILIFGLKTVEEILAMAPEDIGAMVDHCAHGAMFKMKLK